MDKTALVPGAVVQAGEDTHDMGYISDETPLTVIWIGGEADVPDADPVSLGGLDNETFGTDRGIEVVQVESPGLPTQVIREEREGVSQWLVQSQDNKNIARFRRTSDAWALVAELPGYHLSATPDDTWLAMASDDVMDLPA